MPIKVVLVRYTENARSTTHYNHFTALLPGPPG